MTTDPALLEALSTLTDEVRALRAAIAARPDRGAVYVADAAHLLGCSVSHLRRTIATLPEDRRPAVLPSPQGRPGARPRRRYYWPDADALRAWWASAAEPAPPPPRRARKVRQTGGAVTDWRSLAADLGRRT